MHIADNDRMNSENTYHVIPTDDLKEHDSHGAGCHCKPEVRAEGEGWLIIHNSYDGREFFESDSVIQGH